MKAYKLNYMSMITKISDKSILAGNKKSGDNAPKKY